MKQLVTMILLALTVFAFAPVAEAQSLFDFYQVPDGATVRAECVGKFGGSQVWGYTGAIWYGQPVKVTKGCTEAFIANDPDVGAVFSVRSFGGASAAWQYKQITNPDAAPSWWNTMYFATQQACELDRTTNYLNDPPTFRAYKTTPCVATPIWKPVLMPTPSVQDACLYASWQGAMARAAWPSDAKQQFDSSYGMSISLACLTACRQGRSPFCPAGGVGGLFGAGGMFGR